MTGFNVRGCRSAVLSCSFAAMTVRHLRESSSLPSAPRSSSALTHSGVHVLGVHVGERGQRVCVGVRTQKSAPVCISVGSWVLTRLLTCQQTETLWPEPNKVSSPVCGL